MMNPIAIIGIGCRFPGAHGVDGYWKLLRDGIDAVTETPTDRWSNDDWYDPDPATPGKTNIRHGGFLDNITDFDPGFFRIAADEAIRMDPQQRLTLEVCWEALEDAGLPIDRLAGSLTGVFVGLTWGDYSRAHLQDAPHINKHTNVGCLVSLVANRVSYSLDLRGPSVTVDTGCSSSLASVHLGCQALWTGDCDVALCGGANLMVSPEFTIGLSKTGVLSATGRCRPFDATADGHVRGEGVAMVVLKPLTNAVADGDRVYAVIRGSVINQDGLTNGLTAPNRWGQEKAIREACRRANIPPERLQFVEAHGSSNRMGDLIEATAISGAVGKRRADRPCIIGAVKSNFGHTEMTAGAASLIKTALAIHHRAIPPSLHYRQPNPLIDFAKLRLRVASQLEPWPSDDSEPMAGVSSAGAGGTNAHVVLTAAPAESDPASSCGPWVLPLSARSAEALRAMAAEFARFLERSSGRVLALADVCYTAAIRRAHWEHRLAIVASSSEEFAAKLRDFHQGQTPSGVYAGRRGHESPLSGTESHDPLPTIALQHVRGQAVNWKQLYPQGGHCVSLPTYPWQRQRYWLPDLIAGGRR